jgi:hypothetical protein
VVISDDEEMDDITAPVSKSKEVGRIQGKVSFCLFVANGLGTWIRTLLKRGMEDQMSEKGKSFVIRLPRFNMFTLDNTTLFYLSLSDATIPEEKHTATIQAWATKADAKKTASSGSRC